jgi:hypothetical protein
MITSGIIGLAIAIPGEGFTGVTNVSVLKTIVDGQFQISLYPGNLVHL